MILFFQDTQNLADYLCAVYCQEIANCLDGVCKLLLSVCKVNREAGKCSCYDYCIQAASMILESHVCVYTAKRCNGVSALQQ